MKLFLSEKLGYDEDKTRLLSEFILFCAQELPIENKFEISHRVTNKDIKITKYVYFLKNNKKVSLSTENWYNLAKINVGIPKYFDKAIKVYRSEYEKNYVQKVEKRG